ncbi:hypothetical protein [Cryobacterium arcticum]|uniref:hypothetical protein n=1 Tax=Cryobacterium arcticum TaxID=670052 RepID=UPI0012ECCD51|nr:hypothetical protein [Cryobacterium arcticum]
MSFNVSGLRVGESAIYYTVSHGSRGIESSIGASDEDEIFDRKTKHVESIEFRNLVLFPKGASYALLLTERIGGRGIAAFNEKLLKDTIQAAVEGSIFSHTALVTAADLDNVPLLLNAVNFEFPSKTDPDGKFMDVSGLDGIFSLRYRFRKARKLSRYVGKDGEKLSASEVFGVLNPALTAAGLNGSGDNLKELGVKAKLNVTLPSGNTRTFTLGVQEGPALVYALEAEQSTSHHTVSTGVQQESVDRPSVEDFLRVAREVVSDVSGSFTIPLNTVSDCYVPAGHEPVVCPPNWKVVWNEPDHTAASSS